MRSLRFMLALFSMLFRWLGLFRVRALKQFFRTLTTAPSIRVRGAVVIVTNMDDVAALQCFGKSSGRVLSQIHNFTERAAINQTVNHAPDSASARARRQGTGVPGLFSKAPNTKLELVII